MIADPEQLYEGALRAQRQEDWSRMVALCGRLLEARPGHPGAVALLARARDALRERPATNGSRAATALAPPPPAPPALLGPPSQTTIAVDVRQPEIDARPRWPVDSTVGLRSKSTSLLRVGIWLMAAILLSEAAAVVLWPKPVRSPGTGLIVIAQAPTLARLEGTVRVRRQPGGDAHPVDGPAIVQRDDQIETDAAGRATITWPRGAVATLDPQTVAQIRPGIDEAATSLVLHGGALWVDAGSGVAATPIEVVTPDGASAAGRRLEARRDAAGLLSVTTVDLPAELSAGGRRQLVPAGSTSEVPPGGRPSFARPLPVPRALVVAVDGPSAWLLVDPHGRVVGAPPGGTSWLNQLPGARSVRPSAPGGRVVLPELRGDYHLLMWASDPVRDYRVAAWIGDGQALFGGPLPAEPSAATLLAGPLPTARLLVLDFTVDARAVVAGGPARVRDAIPSEMLGMVAVGSSRDAGPGW